MTEAASFLWGFSNFLPSRKQFLQGLLQPEKGVLEGRMGTGNSLLRPAEQGDFPY